MKLTWRERRAVKRAVAAEMNLEVAKIGARVAELQVDLARDALTNRDLELHALALNRWR